MISSTIPVSILIPLSASGSGGSADILIFSGLTRYDTEQLIYEPLYELMDLQKIVGNFEYVASGGLSGREVTLDAAFYEDYLQSQKLKNGFSMTLAASVSVGVCTWSSVPSAACSTAVIARAMFLFRRGE